MAQRLVGFSFVLCVSLLHTVAHGQYIIAHRGASYTAPENTLAAFRLAWAQGADGIEGDFHLSADGRIVCIHDSDTERVAGKKLIVKKTTFEELRKLDVGSWKESKWSDERIPTLQEVLATVPPGKRMFVEIKSGPQIVEPLIQELSNSSVPLECIAIISFKAQVIAACEEQLPELKTYWLTSYKQDESKQWSPTADEVVSTMQRIHADGLGSKALPEHVNCSFFSTLRAGGISDFHVWTVDDRCLARTYRCYGAWAITTNRPDVLRCRF